MKQDSPFRFFTAVSIALSFVSVLSMGAATGPASALPTVTGASPSTTSSSSSSTQAASDSPREGDSSSSASSPAGTTTDADSGTAGSALKGNVATSEQTAESILVELEDTVKHLKDASWGAFTEAQRPDVIYAGGPNVVGGVVIPAVGQSGMLPTGGFLPPRKKWIDYYALHVNYLGPMLKKELQSFKLPDGASSDTLQDYAEYKKISDHLPELCDKMLESCQGPKYDNVTIAMAAGMFNEELKRYDKERKRILKDIRDDLRDTDRDKEKKEKEKEKEKEKK